MRIPRYVLCCSVMVGSMLLVPGVQETSSGNGPPGFDERLHVLESQCRSQEERLSEMSSRLDTLEAHVPSLVSREILDGALSETEKRLKAEIDRSAGRGRWHEYAAAVLWLVFVFFLIASATVIGWKPLKGSTKGVKAKDEEQRSKSQMRLMVAATLIVTALSNLLLLVKELR